ncbi:ABC transporter substrate-binding protein [Yinghuangia sp. ASG 101]|uniref:ABC transporter substrate-binding protein n=1 Tax=Yinghuangia sp. ASG 101 TaxID=2896848 RepID=UPI001E2E73C5|nr:ABC transporter substrate-binding protein [Yinghuangia sp. ASG 101]UGQ12336.1 ABC transporter substrate-binding protein [Yinghuangia sp. ASG 101]
MRSRRTVTTLAMAALLAAGCADRGGSDGEGGAAPAPQATTAASADFGDLKNVCRPGDPSGSSAQGVTDDAIKVGVMSDVGFTKNQEFVDAAKVFTSWCNEAGGINGRKLVANTRDTKMVEVRQRVAEACREDFALVGGGASLDGMGVKDRLSCLLPDFPAQSSSAEADGSDLQVRSQAKPISYAPYAGFYHWLIQEALPQSAGAIGIINGDSPVTKVLGDKAVESLRSAGGTVVYDDLYPASGVTDWTPYAQKIKEKNVRGLVFYGSYAQLAKLEQSLTSLGHKADWIDANNNAYNPAFIELAGNQVLATQNNVADLVGVAPLENAASNPATQRVLDLYAKYAPGAKVTLPSLRAFSAWLVFAKSAASCGDELTRKCVYDAARGETAWTAGGLQAPLDLSVNDPAQACFNAVQATPEGWRPADFRPDKGDYRCDVPSPKLTGAYAQPTTLADVGKSLADLK